MQKLQKRFTTGSAQLGSGLPWSTEPLTGKPSLRPESVASSVSQADLTRSTLNYENQGGMNPSQNIDPALSLHPIPIDYTPVENEQWNQLLMGGMESPSFFDLDSLVSGGQYFGWPGS